MTKSIQDMIFKSRLTIRYRTNISGTSQQERLPFRLLVLGDFEGQAKRGSELVPDLQKRTVRSIKRGATVDDHLAEVVPMWRIPSTGGLKALKAPLPGKVVCERLECVIPKGSIERQESRAYSLRGHARFESHREENGLGDIDGTLIVRGSLDVEIGADGKVQPKQGTLSLSGMVVGDYIDRATEKKVGVVTGVLPEAPLAITADDIVKFEPIVEDGPDGTADAKAQIFSVALKTPCVASAERTIPFTALRDFSPDAVASSVPQLRRLCVLKLLLSELQSELRNRPELRKQVKALLPSYGEKKEQIETKVAGFKELRTWASTEFGLLKLGAS